MFELDVRIRNVIVIVLAILLVGYYYLYIAGNGYQAKYTHSLAERNYNAGDVDWAMHGDPRDEWKPHGVHGTERGIFGVNQAVFEDPDKRYHQPNTFTRGEVFPQYGESVLQDQIYPLS